MQYYIPSGQDGINTLRQLVADKDVSRTDAVKWLDDKHGWDRRDARRLLDGGEAKLVFRNRYGPAKLTVVL